MTDEQTQESQRVPEDGVFVVYTIDWHTLVSSIHRDPREALVSMEEYEQIGFLRWGDDLTNIERLRHD